MNNIMVCDDDKEIVDAIEAYLKSEGYNILKCYSGKQAIEIVEKNEVHLIIMDIMMPEMSGFEVCDIIRKRNDYTDTPIIFLTAKTEKESVIEGFKLGAQDYITKPFDTSELLARVRTHLELRYRKKQLEEINNHLEELVKERTKELEIANEKLSAANEELMKLDIAKSEFLHIIAHEIRTPLNGIKGSIDIIRELNEANSLGVLFNILDESVTRLEKFSLVALKITQLQAGKYELDMQILPCDNIIKTTLDKFKQLIERKSIKVVQTIDKDCMIFGDLELLSSCFYSLIDNAIKFSPEKGNIYINIENSENHILIQIVDEGPGFSQKALDNLFKLFSPGVKHINENEGLDLALVKMIMDAHNGEIQINNYEKGAVVSLIFPKFSK